MILNYSKICLDFLENLPQKQKEVLSRRFGLEGSQRKTLEKIGEEFNLTRERIRQIESNGLAKIRENKEKSFDKIFAIFQDYLKKQGGLKREDILLSDLGGEDFQNQAYFILFIGDPFYRFKESSEFYPFWTTEKTFYKKTKDVLKALTRAFEKKKEPLTESEFSQLSENEKSDVFNSIVEIAKRIEKGPLGDFGLTDWPEIKPRGVKDKAYLALRKSAKPLHFREIAELASQIKTEVCPQREVFPQTVHNELIRDGRFVLVGRGMYALKEWGYEKGIVKDVIADILRKAGKPLTKEEILDRVLSQRLVKKNTILLNLQDKNLFSKDSQGRSILK